MTATLCLRSARSLRACVNRAGRRSHVLFVFTVLTMQALASESLHAACTLIIIDDKPLPSYVPAKSSQMPGKRTRSLSMTSQQREVARSKHVPRSPRLPTRLDNVSFLVPLSANVAVNLARPSKHRNLILTSVIDVGNISIKCQERVMEVAQTGPVLEVHGWIHGGDRRQA